jgi:hypothetical protein
MADLNMSFLKEKLALFLDEKKVEEILEKVITSAGLEKKSRRGRKNRRKVNC